MRASRRLRRQGFILPTTLLVLTLVTVMLAAAFVMVSAEYRTTDNSFASARALAIAQAGLQNYFAMGHILTGTSDSTRYTYSGGYARVRAWRLRDSTTTGPKEPALWVVRAIGYDTVKAPAGQPNAQRAVAHFAQLNRGTLPARAAMVSANAVLMVGAGANPITGVNTGFLAVPGCVLPVNDDTTGLTVPSGDYGGGNPVGIPPGRGIEYLASAAEVIDSTRIDWAALLGGQFTPDYVNQFPPAGNSTYQAHYFTDDVTIPSGQRRGLLVVNGDVTFGSGMHWDGIIVAGGRVIAISSNFILHGVLISGLSLSQGVNVGDSQIRRGPGRVIQWDWCYAQASIGALSYLIPMRNAWADNWSLY